MTASRPSVAAGAAPLAGLAVLMALQLWLIVTHAPWRDEWQAYLLVRDSHGLAGLFANLHYEGHPSLWYLCLKGLQTALHSPRVLTVAQLGVALGTTALVWLRAPFRPWMKLLLLAGYYLLFEYGVIARSYGLGSLLLFAWLAFRRGPWGWLMLALMANVAVHFALLSVACVAAGLWIERRWSWAGAALWAAGCALAVITILPAHDLSTGADFIGQSLPTRLLDAVRRQSAVLIPALVGRWPYQWQVLPGGWAGPAVGALTGLVAVLAVRRDPRAVVLAIDLYLALIALSALVYPTYLRHVGVLVLLVIALEWIRAERTGARPSPIFVAWMTFSAVCGLWAAGCALVVPFAPGQAEGRWIAAHHLDQARWAAYPGYAGQDISTYFGRPTYNLQKQCLDTFIRWDRHAYDDMDYDVLAGRIETPGPFDYLVSAEDLASLDSPLRLIARFDHGLGDNDLYLYAVERPTQGVAPNCPAN